MKYEDVLTAVTNSLPGDIVQLSFTETIKNDNRYNVSDVYLILEKHEDVIDSCGKVDKNQIRIRVLNITKRFDQLSLCDYLYFLRENTSDVDIDYVKISQCNLNHV